MSPRVIEIVDSHLRSALGVEPQRASVTFLGLEPITVLRFVDGDELVYATLGCARHPMSDPSDLNPDPVRGPRVELVVRMRAEQPLAGLHRRMATLAAAPAVEGLILAADALVDLSEPLWDHSACTAVLLEADEIAPASLPEPMNAVTFLRAIPITANEAAWVRLKGADALREAWIEAGIDVRAPKRSSATPS